MKIRKVLIVDDSITAGTMVIEAIDRLKKVNLEIVACLVLFEVVGNQGKENLYSSGVHLMTICTYNGQSNILAKAI